MLYKSTTWGTITIMESIEISLRSDISNKEDGMRLSKSWLPAYEMLKPKLICKAAHLKGSEYSATRNCTCTNVTNIGAIKKWK